MEWVETTGRNIEEAKRFALEQLGVAEADAEVEVLSEPKMGLFGRLKEEARVRARVRPRYPRAKGERRERRHHRAGQPDNAQPAAEVAALGPGSGAGAGTDDEGGPKGTGADSEGTGHSVPARRRPRRPAPAKPVAVDDVPSGALATPSVPAEEQLRHAHEFLEGLIIQLGVAATVTSHPVTDDTVEFLVQGEDIGALIGPRGTTLLALQELTRTVAQRHAGFSSLRILVDVNGYRKRRQEALARFAEKVAAEVRATNSSRALEPMTAADRKVVHDAVGPIAGVTTISEGEEPYRKVVLLPAPAGAEAAPEVAEEPAVVPRPRRARAKKAEAPPPASEAGVAGAGDA